MNCNLQSGTVWTRRAQRPSSAQAPQANSVSARTPRASAKSATTWSAALASLPRVGDSVHLIINSTVSESACVSVDSSAGLGDDCSKGYECYPPASSEGVICRNNKCACDYGLVPAENNAYCTSEQRAAPYACIRFFFTQPSLSLCPAQQVQQKT